MVVAGAAVFPNANPLVLLASVLFAAGAPNAKVEDEDEAVLAVVVLAGTAAPEAAPLPKVNMPPELGAAAVVSFLAPPPKLKVVVVSFFESLLVVPKVNED